MPQPTTVMELIRELTFHDPRRKIFVKHEAIGQVEIKSIKTLEIPLEDDSDDDDDMGVMHEKIVVIECAD